MASKLALAAMACMNSRALDAAIEHGGLSKSDIATINALRADGGRHGSDIAKGRLTAAIRKQFAERDRMLATARVLVEDYARKRVEEVMPMPTPTDLKVAKAATTVAALREAIADYQASHPSCSRADAIDKVLFSRPVSDLHQAERRLTELQKLGGGSLPTPRPGTMHRTHNDAAPVRGRTGYDAGVDDRRPFNPDSGENPIIRDHHQVLDDIKSGKLLWNDPKVQALVALERKRIFEND